MKNVPLLSLLLLLIIGCGSNGSESHQPSDETLVGSWRALLTSPGGELPFTLVIEQTAAGLSAVTLNDKERAPLSSVKREDNDVLLSWDFYDSQIRAQLSEDGQTLEGTWVRRNSSDESTLPFTARKNIWDRFEENRRVGPESGLDVLPTVAGKWSTIFIDDDGKSEPALGEFHQHGDKVAGSFLTPTGDYRYLDGEYKDGLLRLSTFDGRHAFLFHARAQPDGALEGDFWSRDSYHATWTAHRLDESSEDSAQNGDVLPDPYELAGLANSDGKLRFSFPDRQGNVVSLTDEEYRGKVVLVNIVGSWCPNCHDEAPILSRWYREYKSRGLEIVGLCFELTQDEERSWEQIKRFAVRHGTRYPLLLAGKVGKEEVAKALPDLTGTVAYPTTIFVGRDGKVRRIHSGFSGPATGDHHTKLLDEFKSLIEELLDEMPPSS